MEENELDSYINEEVPVPEGDEAKVLHKNKLVMDKRIIVDSIKDQLIQKVSSLKTPKDMSDARKNRTIMENAREMLHDQYIPMHLWEEATRTAVYVQNGTLHKVLKNKTPEEVFFDKKPEVSHLRTFDCPVYIHILKEKRTKLDPLGSKGICGIL